MITEAEIANKVVGVACKCERQHVRGYPECPGARDVATIVLELLEQQDKRKFVVDI